VTASDDMIALRSAAIDRVGVVDNVERADQPIQRESGGSTARKLDAAHRNELRNSLHAFDPGAQVLVRREAEAALACHRSVREERDVTGGRVT